MTKEWEANKETILFYYYEQKRPLKDVLKIMKEKHGFKASTRTYRNWLKKWDIKKYKARRSTEPGDEPDEDEDGSSGGPGGPSDEYGEGGEANMGEEDVDSSSQAWSSPPLPPTYSAFESPSSHHHVLSSTGGQAFQHIPYQSGLAMPSGVNYHNVSTSPSSDYGTSGVATTQEPAYTMHQYAFTPMPTYDASATGASGHDNSSTPQQQQQLHHQPGDAERQQLFAYIESGNGSGVRNLINQDHWLLGESGGGGDAYGFTPLTYAQYLGQNGIASVLRELAANNPPAPSPGGPGGGAWGQYSMAATTSLTTTAATTTCSPGGPVMAAVGEMVNHHYDPRLGGGSRQQRAPSGRSHRRG